MAGWTIQSTPWDGLLNQDGRLIWSETLQLFILVSDIYYGGVNNNVLTSPDGITWINHTGVGIYDFVGLWGHLALRDDSTPLLIDSAYTSIDGISWDVTTNPLPGGGISQAACWSPDLGLWVIWTNNLYTSPDGHTWTLRTTPWDHPPMSSSTIVMSIAWSAPLNLFAVIGLTSDSPYNVVMTSPDGITWTAQSGMNGFAFGFDYDICWSDTLGAFLVAGSDNPGTNCMGYSTDGITWQMTPTSPFIGEAQAVIEVDGIIYAGGYNYTGSFPNIMVSSDLGATWTDDGAIHTGSFYQTEAFAYSPSLRRIVALVDDVDTYASHIQTKDLGTPTVPTFIKYFHEGAWHILSEGGLRYYHEGEWKTAGDGTLRARYNGAWVIN